MASQQDILVQMFQQLRVLDPSVSAEVGTPERKILDTVAVQIAASSIDLNLLNGALDLDAKFGSDLDQFLAIFGFGRQQGARSIGFVTFSRVTPSTYDIPITAGTQVLAPNLVLGATTTSLIFITTETVTLPAGQLAVIAPIQCVFVGAAGNVAANQINVFSGTPLIGITQVTNVSPTTNGIDTETDAEFKVRFKNTVFRNLSGTESQYLALAVATAFSTKANVIGPISRYREYVQVPAVDDLTADPNSGLVGSSGGNPGLAGVYTTALSTIPYSKHVYNTIPYYVSNGANFPTQIFYRQDIDFALNSDVAAVKDRGDTYRLRNEGQGLNPATDSGALFQPNLALTNIYTGTDPTVQSIRPRDILLFEHSYMSNVSRNDYGRNITNCVDVFVNGQNPTTADMVAPKPTVTFTTVATSPFYVDNFRRIGEPKHRPVAGNLLTGFFWQPVIDVPAQIQVGNSTYLEGVHYWVVEDKSSIGGTVRARNGLEWATGLVGLTSADDPTTNPGIWSGTSITANPATSLTISQYVYDQNIVDLQSSLEANKQVTTDVLAHQATTRYFKLDLTVMYNAGSSATDANNSISTLLGLFFDGQYFGTTIQLSDLLQQVHNATGVDNVRWSKEILDAQARTTDSFGNQRNRIIECDINGKPLTGIILERIIAGTTSNAEVWQMYFTGTPTGGTYEIDWNGNRCTNIAFATLASSLATSLTTAGIPVGVSGLGTPLSPFILTFGSNGAQPNMTAITSQLTGGTAIFNSDFFLQDNELPALPTGAQPGDTLPGLVIRPRAQNVWNQL